MPGSVLLLPLALAQIAAGADPSGRGSIDLTAAAAASPRPAECLPVSRRGLTERQTLWDHARRPELRRYCSFLARGYSRLQRSPADAKKAADAADAALPGRAGPAVLQARAALALGDAATAWKRFSRARELDKRSVEAPAALHDLAISALRTGHVDEALTAYRALVPRAGLLGNSARRQRVYVEAALLASEHDASALDEAIGYLSEARRRGSPPGFSQYVLSALALTLDRQGRSEEARGVAAEAGGPWSLARAFAGEGEPRPRARPSRRPEIARGTLHALVAMLAHDEDRALAREHWKAFLDSDQAKGRWGEHAKKKLASLAQAPRRWGRRR